MRILSPLLVPAIALALFAPTAHAGTPVTGFMSMSSSAPTHLLPYVRTGTLPGNPRLQLWVSWARTLLGNPRLQPWAS